MSTFHGLETARRAIHAQQAAIHTTGHNIANAGTGGYSRQRVNLSAASAFPGVSMNTPFMAGQLGAGVQAGAIERVRDTFLDGQYRNESGRHGEWSTRHGSLDRVEGLFNEISGNGIGTSMDRFWQSLHDLGTNPSDTGVRAVVKENGAALAEAFNYTSDGLNRIETECRGELKASEQKINQLLQQINDANKQIASLEAHGQRPNDLYDARDTLVDELSGFLNIAVEQTAGPKSGMAGRYTINLTDDSGRKLETLVDGPNLGNRELRIGFDEDTGLVEGIYTGSAEDFSGGVPGDGAAVYSISEFQSRGSLHAAASFYGYVENGEIHGTLQDVKNDFDQLAYTYVTEFNRLHEEGFSLNGEGGMPFFDPFAEGRIQGAAGNMVLNSAISSDVNNIAASSEPEGTSGNGNHAAVLANMREQTFNFGGMSTNASAFYQSITGKVAVQSSEAARMSTNALNVVTSIGERRESVSGVSLDEEMSNLVQFQHAYNAAARNMTAIDEMLDRIINGMGITGR
ncbi:flagellar hook-associated protein FlgK [Alteribacter lacisalsi]|uniref:Flagellar hook-associated protein 1 n=1 Tax=Alteribacter lacisalsi TaxID=2045244 RepID=A0A2W0HG39_9BACI|nr:flagellar hook-associated protein FlgK [Alteribacter lacisalsi]PYZ95852.1 flagellar hook-associated protein FlgK [Alteribacter lacisalsi]